MNLYFKFIETKLYVTMDAMVEAGFDANTLTVSCSRGFKTLPFIKDPENLKRTLFDYEHLGKRYKEAILKRWPKPYDEVVMQPIRNMIKEDLAAEKYYLAYRNEDNKSLPIEHVRKYTRACEVLNMLIEVGNDKKALKKLLKISISEFWIKVGELIKADKIFLPTTYRRLTEKVKDYQSQGYECIIDGKLGNTNGVKVNDEVAESLLLEMIADPKQHDDVYIADQYNAWARKNDRKEIVAATVGNYRRRNKDIIIMQREGREAYYNQISKSIPGYRPSTPLYLVESDDNHLDFFFVDWEDKTGHKYFNKFKAIVVTDSYNDYVLGYAYAQELTAAVVRKAYLNAMYHIKELTGDWHLPHEIKTDRWAIKDLEPFYSSLGNYFKTPVGSKRRGYIEQFFGSTAWERAAKDGTNNYTGHNITAKTEGVNKEVLLANKKDFPTIQEAPRFIENFFHRLRMTKEANGLTKQENWINAFNAASPDKLRIISDEQFLVKLGTLRPETNRITSNGLEITINNLEYRFDIPDEYYFQYKGKQVQTIYDPNDMSRILVTDFSSLRFIATTPYYQPRALADYKEGDRARLNEHLEAKKRHVEMVSTKEDRRKEVLRHAGLDAASLLTSGMVLKEDRQREELEYQIQLLEYRQPTQRRIDPLSKM
ncbi:MAG: Mu transposase C-terminal domain-containing protein [Ginsengibacter sp.]